MKFLLILVSLIGLGAVIGAVVVGTRTFDGTVVDKPYEQGLSYDAVHHEKEASGWNVQILNKELTSGSNDILLSVTDRNGRPVTDTGVTVVLGRPSSSSYDRTYNAASTGEGTFKIAADLPLYGYWNAKIQITAQGKSIIFEKTIFAEQKKRP